MKISQTVSQLWSRHEYIIEMTMFNVQMAITLKVGKPELWFMCSAHCLMVLYIAVKFPENISNSIRVMEQKQNHKVLTDGWTAGQTDRHSNNSD